MPVTTLDIRRTVFVSSEGSRRVRTWFKNAEDLKKELTQYYVSMSKTDGNGGHYVCSAKNRAIKRNVCELLIEANNYRNQPPVSIEQTRSIIDAGSNVQNGTSLD